MSNEFIEPPPVPDDVFQKMDKFKRAMVALIGAAGLDIHGKPSDPATVCANLDEIDKILGEPEESIEEFGKDK